MATARRCNKRICFWATAGLVLLASSPPGPDGPGWARADGWLTQLLLGPGRQEPDDSPAKPETGESGGVRSTPAAQAEQESESSPAREPTGKRRETDTIQVSKAGTVEMHADGLPLSKALEILAEQSRRNIVATPNVGGTVTGHLYNVTFEEALDAILVANQAGYREVGHFIYVYTNDELAKIIAAQTPPITRVFTLSYIPAKDALAIVTPMLSDGGSAVASPEPETGLSSESERAGGESSAHHDYLVVRDHAEVLERIAQTLREVDVRPQQVLVEATILGVTLDDQNSLGVDFSVVGGVDLELLGSTSTAVTNLNVGALPTERFEKFNSNVTGDFTGIVPQGGMTFGVIKDHVGAFIRALESITDTVVLANPKVLALNKQKAQVIVGRRDGYLTTTVTETQAIQTVEFLETGTQLIFRPFIGDDDFVRMELHPEDSVGTVANGLPSERTTEVTTNVLVKDGQTILIGGLFREVGTENRNQIPLLGDIPVMGTVFQGRADRTERQEVIILLTVHIVKDHDAYARAGEQVRQDIERIRVGLRRHMMWNGRERFAQAYYRKSLEHFAKGEADKALWEVRMALYNNPHLVAAAQLKEEILGRRDWDDEGAATRAFIHDLIQGEQGLSEPEYERPAPPFVRPDELQGPNGFEEGAADDAS